MLYAFLQTRLCLAHFRSISISQMLLQNFETCVHMWTNICKACSVRPKGSPLDCFQTVLLRGRQEYVTCIFLLSSLHFTACIKRDVNTDLFWLVVSVYFADLSLLWPYCLAKFKMQNFMPTFHSLLIFHIHPWCCLCLLAMFSRELCVQNMAAMVNWFMKCHLLHILAHNWWRHVISCAIFAFHYSLQYPGMLV